MLPVRPLTSSSSGSQWTSLLKQATSGNGLASAFTGGLGGLGGVGSLVSGIMNLFGGGKKTPAALTAFELPTSQQRTVSIGSPVSGSVSLGSAGQNAPRQPESMGVRVRRNLFPPVLIRSGS